jgi:hypothetical protein
MPSLSPVAKLRLATDGIFQCYDQCKHQQSIVINPVNSNEVILWMEVWALAQKEQSIQNMRVNVFITPDTKTKTMLLMTNFCKTCVPSIRPTRSISLMSCQMLIGKIVSTAFQNGSSESIGPHRSKVWDVYGAR